MLRLLIFAIMATSPSSPLVPGSDMLWKAIPSWQMSWQLPSASYGQIPMAMWFQPRPMNTMWPISPFLMPKYTAPQQGSSDSTPPLKSFRLPRSLKPLHYKVKLQPFVNGNFSILGYVEVEVEVVESTSNITLHILDIITDNDTVKVTSNCDGHNVQIKFHEYDAEQNFYIAHLTTELQKGEIYVLSMNYLAYLNDELRGFYRSSYTDAEGVERNIAATDFAPASARRAFPCFDEPGLKATFEVFLMREPSMTALASTPRNESAVGEGQGEWLYDHFQETSLISPYQLGFMITKFGYLNTTEHESVAINVWASQPSLQQATYAKEIAPNLLSHLEDFLGENLLLPKVDLVAVPEVRHRATDSMGITTLRERNILYHPEVSGIDELERVTHAVSFALAQQCLGDLISRDWWEEVCLDRGLVTYLEYIGVDFLEPDWKVMETFVTSKLHKALEADSLESSHGLLTTISRPAEMAEVLDHIPDEKGPSIFRMLSNIIGEATFRKGLTNYFDMFRNATSTSADLWDALTTAAFEDDTLPTSVTVKDIMDTWTLQNGYPVIHVVRSPNGTSATISQERFLLVNSASGEASDYRWWIPLTYTFQAEEDFNKTEEVVWIADKEKVINVISLPPKDQWVLFNLQQTGFYRVNYDYPNWKLIIQQLNEDHEAIYTINRAQIIDDALNLARAGKLSYETALAVLPYLEREAEYLPWAAALNNLAYLNNMLSMSPGYNIIKNFLLELIIPQYNTLGISNEVEDSHPMQLLQQLIVSWACKLGYPDCLSDAIILYREWMTSSKNTTVSPNLKESVYCHVIAEGSEDEWVTAWQRYLKSSVESEKNALLYGLGCSKDVATLSRFLEMAYAHSDIKRQDSSIVFQSIARNVFGRSVAWNFLRKRWNELYTYNKRDRAKMLKEVTHSFNKRDHLQELELFVHDPATDKEGSVRGMYEAIERTKINIVWMESNYSIVTGLLEGLVSSREAQK